MDIESLDIKSLPFVRLSNRGDLPDVSGIYFVVDERGVPVYYIGQSASLKKRWIQHDKLEVFERHESKGVSMFIHYLEIEGEEVDRHRIETRAIDYFVSLMNYQTRGILRSKPFAAPRAASQPNALLNTDVDATEKEPSLDIREMFQALRSFSDDMYGFQLPNILALEVQGECNEYWFERKGEDLMRVIESFLSIFFNAACRETNKLSPSSKRMFSLMVATSLNKARHKFMAESGLIRGAAADKITGVGSIQMSWNGHFSLCVSESYKLPEGTPLVDVIHGLEEDSEPGTLETVDTFFDNGAEFKMIF